MTSSAPASRKRIRSSTSSVAATHRIGTAAIDGVAADLAADVDAVFALGPLLPRSMIASWCSATSANAWSGSVVAGDGVAEVGQDRPRSSRRRRVGFDDQDGAGGHGASGALGVGGRTATVDWRIHRRSTGATSRPRGEPSRRPVLDCRPFPFCSVPIGHADVNGAFPSEGVTARMRRYELMLVIRPDVPDDKSQAVIDRITRQITAAGGQIVKVAPWGRRRLAYPIDRYREGSYHIILFHARPTRWPSWSTACSSPRRSSVTS